MKELLQSIPHKARNKEFEIRLYREGEIFTVQPYHCNKPLSEPRSISVIEDDDFRGYHSVSAVETFIRAFVEQIEKGEIDERLIT